MKRALLSSPFSWRISTSLLVGYLLATVPQCFLDPKLTSHVRYGPRSYESSWLIFPISIVVFIATLILSRSPLVRRSSLFVVLPFSLGLIVSGPLFAPEFIHGNLTFIGMLWTAIALVATWTRNAKLIDPSKDSPGSSPQAQLDYCKEQSLFWRTCALGLAGAYLALIIGFITEVRKFNATIVTDPGELFLLNQYSNVQIGLISLFVMVGPILESIIKARSAIVMLLTVGKADQMASDPKGQ